MNVINRRINVRQAKVVSISLPPDMQDEMAQIAKEERRSVSEVIREAFRQYLANRALSTVRAKARKTAKRRGITSKDVNSIIREGRRR
jgi:Arc/MetJ-type ribon-helix-helix transcriptional regulator